MARPNHCVSMLSQQLKSCLQLSGEPIRVVRFSFRVISWFVHFAN